MAALGSEHPSGWHQALQHHAALPQVRSDPAVMNGRFRDSAGQQGAGAQRPLSAGSTQAVSLRCTRTTPHRRWSAAPEPRLTDAAIQVECLLTGRPFRREIVDMLLPPPQRRERPWRSTPGIPR